MAYAAPLAHPYYEKHALLFLFEEKRKPPVGNIHAKKARFRALGGSRVIGATPLIATKAYQNIHLERLAVPMPKGCREMALPAGCNPERAIASVNRCSSLVSYPITDTPILERVSKRRNVFWQSLPKL